MYRRTAIALTICVALLPTHHIWLLATEAAQGRPEDSEQRAKPKPGKPEGMLPNLEEMRKEKQLERQAPPPIPSTIRSKRNTGKPWDGRRVGDPWPEGALDQVVNRTAGSAEFSSSSRRNQRTRRAHASRRVNPPPPVLDNQFVQNFFSWTVARNPFSDENTYWYDQLRVGYGQGQEALKLAAIEFGRTLFESAEYAARNRADHWYVYDLYKAYLMRDPDPIGWANWEAIVPTHGREYVRRGFEESGEFAGLIANISPNGSATSNAASLISARVDARNQPGNGMLTRDTNWSVPLLSLPGRAGLDLGLVLSYSSMVWTRSGPYIYFDEDNGFPSPGFRLGFPTVQRKVFAAQTARNAYLLITGSGKRVELRQVGSSNIYDAADSSYLRLTDNGSLVVQSADGTRLTLTYFNGEFHCTEVKDSNGNYITVNYNSLGQITNITDTLTRVINFNYDNNANLLSITQSWAGQPSHQWASFVWSTRTMQSSFSDASLRGVIGTANGTVVPVITQVALNDTSHFTFEYNNSLQVSELKNYFGTLERNATTFTYETPAGDAPRLVDSRVSALNWTGINNVPAQVITQYGVAADGACVMTAPDGTVYKEYYGTGWQKGLTTLSEVWSGGVRKKWITTAWTQDDTNLSYQKNPRPYDTSVYDEAGNRRRVETTYTSYNLPDAVALPTEVKEYKANGTDVLRRTTTLYYDGGQPYIDRRVLGLLREVIVYDQNNQPQSRVWYDYDWTTPDAWVATPQPAPQHDPSGDARGRGNLMWIGRWDVSDFNNSDKVSRSYRKYNRTGAVIKTEDHFGHGKTISYTDSFSDGDTTRNTFAYPTTITDGNGFSSYLQYNFDIGATTRTESPAPAGQSQGAIQTITYNNLGQLERTTTVNTGAYTRYFYGPYYIESFATVNNISDDAFTNRVFDGLGRVRALASNYPDSDGGYKAQLTVYDLMGRSVSTSNPAEIKENWEPAGDDHAGWIYTQQSYDWQGRPRITTGPDASTAEISYNGCGCAGDMVITTTDPVARKTRIYHDVLGREWKAEILNTNGTVYATTVNAYNGRDQILSSKQYVGLATTDGSCPTNTCQETSYGYDGHGRLSSRHLPEQASGTSTVYTYRPDDTLWTETDSRGATTTYTYNGRGLPTVIHYNAPSGISVPADTTVEYDAAGNRSSMVDARGTVSYDYDQLSRLKHEKRFFSALPNAPVTDHKYTISYDYNLAGNLTSITDPFGDSFSYTRNALGQLKAVTGSPYAGVTNYVTNVTYRAWGAPKGVNYVGRSSTIAFNWRLQPSAFTLTGGGGIRESYSYYADGRLHTLTDLDDTAGSNPPVTLRFLSRGYNYDHVGRVTNGFGTGSGAPGVPFTQTYSYDAFGNMTGRSGSYYNYQSNSSLTSTDTSTYVNNRRTNWSYDLEGQVTSTPLTSTDRPRTMAYNAAGGMVSSVETGQFNTITYAAAYDGDREMVYESSTTSPGTSESSYLVRSSVLGGEVLTRLDQSGNKKITYVPAEGLLFATQRASGAPGPFVLNTYRNPLGITETTKAVYDPLGNYIPFRANGDPRPPAGSYSSASMSGLSSSQADAESYGVGCLSDGIPTACKKVMEDLERNRAQELHLLGPAITPFLTRLMMSLTVIRQEIIPSKPPNQPAGPSGASGPGWTISGVTGELWTYYILAPGLQHGFEQNPTRPQPQKTLTQDDPKTISSRGSKNCRFTISFESGTFYDQNPNLPNGPGEITVNGKQFVGLGFTVSGTTRGGGGIGRIGDQVNPANPNGQWTLDQYTSNYSKQNGEFVVIDGRSQQGGEAWRDIDLKGYHFATDWTNRFSRYDHPSIRAGIADSYKNQSFLIKVHRGKETCQAEFHMVQRGNEIHWGSGAQGVWP